MKKIDLYIFRQLLTTTIFVAVVLTCVVWLTQSLRFVEMIVNRGLSASLFLYFTMLLVPSFLAIILPIALFVAVIFIYNRMLVDSELVVLRAGGYSQYSLASPAIALTIFVMMTCTALSLYFMPAAYREFKDLQFTLRNSYPAVLLQEGVFSPVMKGVTIYVENRADDGELSGIIVHDARSQSLPITMMAERGFIAPGKAGPRVVLENGSRQQVDEKDGTLSLLYFDRYSFDINSINKSLQDRWREPRERFLHELFFSESEKSKVQYPEKLRMEGHHRLSLPLLPLCYTLVALVFLLGGDFDRRGQLFRILGAVLTVILVQVVQLGGKNLGEKIQGMYLLMYMAPILPALAAGWLLNARNRARKYAAPNLTQPGLT